MHISCIFLAYFCMFLLKLSLFLHISSYILAYLCIFVHICAYFLHVSAYSLHLSSFCALQVHTNSNLLICRPEPLALGQAPPDPPPGPWPHPVPPPSAHAPHPPSTLTPIPSQDIQVKCPGVLIQAASDLVLLDLNWCRSVDSASRRTATSHSIPLSQQRFPSITQLLHPSRARPR